MNRLSIRVATWGPPIAGALLRFAALSKLVLNDSFESGLFDGGITTPCLIRGMEIPCNE